MTLPRLKSAVQCGLDMLIAVEKFNEKLEKDGRSCVGMGAGINTGLGYLGEMGSTQRHPQGRPRDWVVIPMNRIQNVKNMVVCY